VKLAGTGSINLANLTVQAIRNGCANAAATYPNWPAAVLSEDLSARLAVQGPQSFWWLAGHPSLEGVQSDVGHVEDDAGDVQADKVQDDADKVHEGMSSCLYYLIISLTMFEVRRQSKRLAKGKAPAPPDMNVRVSEKGKKRSADVAGEVDETMNAAEDEGEDEAVDRDVGDVRMDDEDVEMGSETHNPAPGRSNTYMPSQEFRVVIESPSHGRPKKQYRLNEAGASKPAQDSEKSEVGCEGEVRHILTSMRPHTSHIFRTCVRRARMRHV
jgi:hypothetical protein